jgi:hypothetical protein
LGTSTFAARLRHADVANTIAAARTLRLVTAVDDQESNLAR